MIINIIQTITNTLTEDGELISSTKSEGYSLAPEEGKMLRNKLNGKVYKTKIYLYRKFDLKDYEEIDTPKKDKEN